MKNRFNKIKEDVKIFFENQNDEDFIDFLEIVVKKWVFILIITIASFLISISYVVYQKYSEPKIKEKKITFIDLELKNEISGNSLYKELELDSKKLKLREILEDDDIVIKIFSFPEVMELYRKSTNIQEYEIDSMRDYLKEKIMIHDEYENPNQLCITLDFNNFELSKKLGNLIIRSFEDKKLKNFESGINKRGKYLDFHLALLNEKIEILQKNILLTLPNENFNKIQKMDNFNLALFSNPKLIVEFDKLIEIYRGIYDQKIFLEMLKAEKIDHFLEIKGDYYEILETPESEFSNPFVVVVMGILFGLFLGMVIAIIKDLIERYKKLINK